MLHAAIATSCALHACALFGPYLGSGSMRGIATVHPVEQPRAGLHARLTRMQDATPADPTLLASMQGDTAVTAGTGPAEEIASAARPAVEVVAASFPAATDATPDAAASSGLGLLPFEGIAYYASSQLTQGPLPLGEIALDDPALAPIVASGKMIMTLWINALGEVEKAEVEDSDIPVLFAGPAVAAFKRLRFLPGELQGRAVAAMMKIEVTLDDDRAGMMPPLQVFAADAIASPQPPAGHAAYGGDRRYQ